jgi:glycosyltransferase involved in cell wall biosynthesis
MPAYNAEKYISEAIESVLNQTFTNWELIVVNDGSTDRTEEIILSFDDERICYVKNETNLKLIATLNKGINIASGKYVARMDADDICLPDRFKKQVAFLEKHSDYVLCGAWTHLIDENGKKTGRIKCIDSDNLLKINLFFTVPFIHPSVMVRTDILKKYKYNKQALHVEDFDLWLRLANTGLKMANIPEYLLKYRWHDTNISVVNENYQTEKKISVLIPYIQDFIGRNCTEKELELHEFSFRLYHLGQKKKVSEINLNDEKEWFVTLSKRNKEVKKYRQTDFDAFLWSRWIVCCLITKNITSVFNINLAWYRPNVIYKTLKLFLYK